jgi:hypothetical protein
MSRENRSVPFLDLEQRRLAVQRRLDGRIPAGERNRLGRYATPPALALEMLSLARDAVGPRGAVRFLDPALGTGVFFYAALETFGRGKIERATGFEIDRATAAEASRLWRGQGLLVRTGDFCRAAPPAGEHPKAGLIVCNPPYVRHHHLKPADKCRLRRRVRRLGFDLNGLAGLYAYFMLLADPWLARGGVGVWIIPSEFLDVNYGRQLKAYLAQNLTLLRVHRFDPSASRFPDALVTSSVLLVRKARTPLDHKAVLTFGGTPAAPRRARRVRQADLDPAAKWSPLWSTGPRRRRPGKAGLTVGDLFTVRRGLATGANGYFVLERARSRELALPKRFLRPVLPGPRFVAAEEIARARGGFPAGLRQLVVLDCDLPADEVRLRYPALHSYLRLGRRKRIHLRYLPRHRDPWYAQEHRPPAPILCTYMGRRRGGRFIRFIRNRSDATATNVYHLLYPRPALEPVLDEVFIGLREVEAAVEAAGRTYGGGLVKVEPKELAGIPLPGWVGELARSRLGPIGRSARSR